MNALKAALWTALFSFITLSGAGIIGWLNDVYEWAAGQGATAFPSLSNLGYIVAAGVVSVLIGAVNFAIRWAQQKLGVGAGTVPQYGQPTGP